MSDPFPPVGSRKLVVPMLLATALGLTAGFGLNSSANSIPDHSSGALSSGVPKVETQPEFLPLDTVPPLAPPTVLDAIATATRACEEWKDGTATGLRATADEAARLVDVCNMLAPEDRVEVTVPSATTSLSLQPASIAIGIGFGALLLLALRGLFAGARRQEPARAEPARIERQRERSIRRMPVTADRDLYEERDA